MPSEVVAVVRLIAIEEPKSVWSPRNAGYGFVPDVDGKSRPVEIFNEDDARWFEQREDAEVDWLDREEPDE